MEATDDHPGSTDAIVSFLTRIGIAVTEEPFSEDGFLPGVVVREGGLVYDPARLLWPSDLLHEAGHIAVTDPLLRPTLSAVADDPGEEMAAIAWSYAAAVAVGLDARTLFHDGYKGGGASLAENFTAGRDVGVPMLEHYGMTQGRQNRRAPKAAPYPTMTRWLR
jgi:hypothetical protein